MEITKRPYQIFFVGIIMIISVFLLWQHDNPESLLVVVHETSRQRQCTTIIAAAGVNDNDDDDDAGDDVIVGARNQFPKNTSTNDITPLRDIREFFEYIETPLSSACHNATAFGGQWQNTQDFNKSNPSERMFNGDKIVCQDAEFSMMPGNCLVYSFGVSNEWSFDEAMADYGCQVHAFDPSIEMKSQKKGENITFYNLGIGNRTEYQIFDKWLGMVMPLDIIMQLLGHMNDDIIIDYLKIDVEGAEVPALEYILHHSQHTLQKIKQIGLEIHLGKYSDSGIELYQKYFRIFKKLEKFGFKMFSSRMNPALFAKYFLPEVGHEVHRWYELVFGKWI